MPWMKINPYGEQDVFVDEQDVGLVEKYNWVWDGRYVKRKVNGKRNGPDKPRDPAKVFYLHREIMMPDNGLHVDHIDGDPRNNSRSNLRICTQADNNKNICGSGVQKSLRPQNKKKPWTGAVTHNYKRYHVGSFATEEEALEAVRIKRVELRGEFAKKPY